MQVVPNALPDRKIIIRKGSGVGGFLISVVFLFLPWFTISQQLYKDLTAPNDLVAVPSKVSRYRCTTYNLIVTVCDVDLNANGEKKSFGYWSFSVSLPDNVTLLKSISSPSYYTTTLGRDILPARVLLLAVYEAFWLLVIVFHIIGVIKSIWRAVIRAVSRAPNPEINQNPELVLLDVKKMMISRRTITFTYVPDEHAEPVSRIYPKNNLPVLVEGSWSDKNYLLAVKDSDMPPMLLFRSRPAIMLSWEEWAHLFDVVKEFLDGDTGAMRPSPEQAAHPSTSSG